MDDPQGVSDLESLGNLAGGLKSIIHRERSLLDPHGQGLAFGQLHDEEALPFVFFETVEGGDILVAERGEQLGSATDVGSTLIATSRSSRSSWARYTSPIPPSPILSTMR
jgi:hypothetical protein